MWWNTISWLRSPRKPTSSLLPDSSSAAAVTVSYLLQSACKTEFSLLPSLIPYIRDRCLLFFSPSTLLQTTYWYWCMSRSSKIKIYKIIILTIIFYAVISMAQMATVLKFYECFRVRILVPKCSTVVHRVGILGFFSMFSRFTNSFPTSTNLLNVPNPLSYSCNFIHSTLIHYIWSPYNF